MVKLAELLGTHVLPVHELLNELLITEVLHVLLAALNSGEGDLKTQAVSSVYLTII